MRTCQNVAMTEMTPLVGESILCFAPDRWTDIWRNRHQIMSRLAMENRVLYVEPRPYLRDVLGHLGQGCDPRPRCYQTVSGVHVYRSPRYAPLSGREPLASLAARLRSRLLEANMRRLGMGSPIVWLFRPEHADIPGRYGESLLIYHIVDDYGGYWGENAARRAAIEARERALMARADLVIVTSRALLETKAGVNPNTHLVRNAVDWDRFRTVLARRDEPEMLRGRSHPRIGYVGALNDKIDTGLLLHVADSYPEGTLLLVGPDRVQSSEARRDLDALHERANVCMVGRVAVNEVPEYMGACDVGLLPYRLNAWTRHIHPLKLYEYLASGLGVVSTDIPSVWEAQELVHIAEDAAGFVAGIRLALSERGDSWVSARRERAQANTWEQRVARISQLIAETRRQMRSQST